MEMRCGFGNMRCHTQQFHSETTVSNTLNHTGPSLFVTSVTEVRVLDLRGLF